LDDMPAWSPDGTQIAFTRQDWPDSAVMVVPADGGEPRPVLDLPGHPYINPTRSPDGERLAVVAVGPTLSPLAAGTIWTVAADGSDLRELATIGGAHTLGWHPDGVTLLVSTLASDGGSVRSVDVATGDVTIPAEHASMATWAPDGKGVYYLDGDVHEGPRRLAYGRIVGGRLERQRFVVDVVVGGYPNRYFGTDTGPCPSGG
jgi:Tol biopolymer transport system component